MIAIDPILLIEILAAVAPIAFIVAYLAHVSSGDYALIIDARGRVIRPRLKRIINTSRGQVIKLSPETHNISIFLKREDLPQFFVRKGLSAKLVPVFIAKKDSLIPLSLDAQPPAISTAELQQMLERDSLRSLMRFRMGKMDMVLYIIMGLGMGIPLGMLFQLYVIPPPPHPPPPPPPPPPPSPFRP